VFVTTKLPPEAAGRERRTLTDSLRALQVEYVDLWLVHWPPPGRAPLQTWKQLLAIRDEGLARAVGVSNHSTAQLDELIAATCQAPPSRLEQALAVAQIGQHQHRGQEPDGRGQTAQLLQGDLGRQDAQDEGKEGGRDRHHRLGQATRPDHRERKRGREQKQRDRLGKRPWHHRSLSRCLHQGSHTGGDAPQRPANR
jgi:hypothetical protein